MLECNGHCTVPIIGNASCQHFKENNPHGVDVTLNSCLGTTRLLRGEIVNRPQHGVGLGQAGLRKGHCDTKVCNLGSSILGQKDILRF